MSKISEDKLKRLQKYLVKLGDKEIHALTRAIEYGRTINFEDIPAAEILELIRPALVELRPKHIPTRDRVLCEPCEDLFISYVPDVKREALIERRTIRPFITRTAELLGEELDKAEAAMIENFKRQRWADLEQRKLALCASAAVAWRTLLDGVRTPDTEKALLISLGGTDRYEDIREAAACLEVAGAIRDLRLLHPNKPIVRPKKELIDAMVTVLANANATAPKASDMVIWTIYRRLKERTDIMSVFRSMDATKTVWCQTIQDVRDRIEKSLLQEFDETADELKVALKRGRISPDTLFNELETYLDEMDRVKISCSRGNIDTAKKSALNHIRTISALVEETVIKTAKKSITPTVESLLMLIETGQELNDETAQMIDKAERIALSFKRLNSVADRIGAKSSYERERQVLDKTLVAIEDRLKLWLNQHRAKNPEVAQENILYLCRLIEITAGNRRSKDAKRRLFTGFNK